MENGFNCPKKRGGKRNNAGRKKTRLNKIPYNRRISEKVINILKNHGRKYEKVEINV